MAVYALENGAPVDPSAPVRDAAGPKVKGERHSRREWLAEATRLAAGLPLALSPLGRAAEASAESPPIYSAETAIAGNNALVPQQSTNPTQSAFSALFTNDPTKYRFTRDEDQFLEELERACFQFFWDEASPYTGLVKDRSQADGSDSRNVA